MDMEHALQVKAAAGAVVRASSRCLKPLAPLLVSRLLLKELAGRVEVGAVLSSLVAIADRRAKRAGRLLCDSWLQVWAPRRQHLRSEWGGRCKGRAQWIHQLESLYDSTVLQRGVGAVARRLPANTRWRRCWPEKSQCRVSCHRQTSDLTRNEEFDDWFSITFASSHDCSIP